MSWWKKQTENVQQKPEHFPLVCEIVPQRLRATVHLHSIDIGPNIVPCWSFVSSGFSSVGQKEIVFTVKREDSEPEVAFPKEPLEFFQQIYPLACEEKYVDAGGFTGLGPGFLAPQFGGILYEKSPLRIPEMELPTELLSAIVVTPEEFTVGYQFGNLRVLSLLGDQSRYYPFPYWIDRRRAGVVSRATQQQMAQGVLSKVPYLKVTNCGAIANQKERLRILLERKNAVHFQNALRQIPQEGAPFAVQLSFEQSADSCLVWQPPGTPNPRAIADSAMTGGSPPGTDSVMTGDSRMSGAFVLFAVPHNDSAWNMIDDGFIVALDSSAWIAVRDALISANDITLAMPTRNQCLEIAWRTSDTFSAGEPRQKA